MDFSYDQNNNKDITSAQITHRSRKYNHHHKPPLPRLRPPSKPSTVKTLHHCNKRLLITITYRHRHLSWHRHGEINLGRPTITLKFTFLLYVFINSYILAYILVYIYANNYILRARLEKSGPKRINWPALVAGVAMAMVLTVLIIVIAIVVTRPNDGECDQRISSTYLQCTERVWTWFSKIYYNVCCQ